METARDLTPRLERLRDLHLSKGAAFHRATAADLVARFSGIADALGDGRLCLTTILEVAKVLTPESQETVLPRFFGLSRREAQEIVAELRPRETPPLRDVVRVPRSFVAATAALPLAPPPPEPDRRQLGQPTTTVPPPEERSAAPEPLARSVPMPSPAPDAVEPLTAELTRLDVTVSRRLLAKLEAARAALSHSHPGAGMAEILEAGLDLVLDRRPSGTGS